MTGGQKPKRRGYAVEIAALKALKPVFPWLRRTGSTAYKKAAADLVQDSGFDEAPICIVVTRDKNKPLLVTLSSDDFVSLMGPGHEIGNNVVVQVKGRERTWVGRLYQELKAAPRDGA